MRNLEIRDPAAPVRKFFGLLEDDELAPSMAQYQHVGCLPWKSDYRDKHLDIIRVISGQEIWHYRLRMPFQS